MNSLEKEHQILLSFDLEKDYFPKDFEQVAAFSRLEELRVSVEDAFGIACGKNLDTQDGCYYGIITLKELGTGAWRPAIHLCSFGRMVAIDNEAELVPGALEKLKHIFDLLGFTYISEAAVQAPYDGVDDHIATWWQRYFDVL